MRLLRSLLSVSLVCVLLFALFSVTSYATDDASYWDYYNEGLLIPSPDFPNKEALPYGDDTAIYDFYRHTTSSDYLGVTRIYVKRKLYSGSAVSAFNGTSVLMVDNKTGTYPAFEILVTSDSIIYYQYYEFNYATGKALGWSDVSMSSYTKSKNGLTYNFLVISGQISQSYSNGKYNGVYIGTDPSYYGGRDTYTLLEQNLLLTAPADELPAHSARYWLSNIHKSYPTSNDLATKDIVNSIDESTNEITSTIQSESNNIQTAIWDNTAYILEYQSYQLDELISINGAINENGEKLDNLNDTLEETPNKIIEGIKGLFIPDEQEMIAIKDKWELLMSDRFGALYEAGSFITDYVENFKYQGEKNTITFPTVSTSFSDTYFEFGGWEVQLVPDKFNPFMVTVKSIIGIVCTLAFIVMLRNKFNKIVGDNT